jgi:hypothetical protein
MITSPQSTFSAGPAPLNALGDVTDQGSEKRMKRSFKLATVFTGAGALTGVFAPAALAAPANTAAVAKPDIGPAKECGANNGGVSNWVHLYYPNNDHPAECIGGAGTLPVKATIRSFCAGNNNGYVTGNLPFHFHPSSPRTDLLTNVQLTAVHISSWVGHAKCT